MPQTLNAIIEGGLNYKWQLCVVRPSGFKSKFCMNKVFSNWQSLLWCEKGNSKPIRTISDVVFGNNNEFKTYHSIWSKNTKGYAVYINAFTDENDLIFDPFSGGGTVPAVCKMYNRNFIACEIDNDLVNKCKLRLNRIHPKLFDNSIEQKILI